MKSAMILFYDLLNVEQVSLLSLSAIDLRQRIIGVPANGIQEGLGGRVFVNDD
jgi:hypothetical protein